MNQNATARTSRRRFAARLVTRRRSLFGSSSSSSSSVWVLVKLAILMTILLSLLTIVNATSIACQQDADCEQALMKGSICLPDRGTCSNPFHERGCLATLMPEKIKRQRNNKIRVCTSADPSSAADAGYCRPMDPVLHYREVRIYAQNWESVFFEAWILQILLSEYLGVAVTLETGMPDVRLDFHDEQLSFGYGAGNDYSCLENSIALGGDCTLANRLNINQPADVGKDTENNSESDNYQSCAHFVPEIWTTQANRLKELRQDGVIEKHEGLGVVGQMNWWIPKFTALRDPTLLTYFGLAGQEQRRKLAEVFKRPTTWGEYCSQVSLTRCQEPDSVASRAPINDREAGRYFEAENYMGHFRKTEESDCDLHPDTCTGHIADFPCGWSSFVQQQTWHLGIPLSSSGSEPGSRGYKYGELLDIFAAANATKSDIIFQWWTPDVVHNAYAGTDAEFQAVGMPLPTLECIENAVSSEDRCDPDVNVRRGSAEGACGEPPYPLMKAYSSILFDITKGENIPEAEQNPAYDLFKAFSLTSLELGDFYDRWLERGTNPSFDLRYATCEWIVENWELMETFIPRDFPRLPQENDYDFDQGLYLAAVVLAAVASVSVIATAAWTHLQRDRPAVKNAQIGFLWILLIGLALVAAGAVSSFLQPSKVTCTLTPWFVNLGYTMELIPLIVKVAAIQKLMQAARHMRRVNVNMRYLYGWVVVVCSVVVVVLLLWTILDSPDKAFYSTLSKDKTDSGETIIFMTPYCTSDTDLWRYLTAAWHSVLLVAATLLAFQTRKLKTDFGETETLGIMVYSHVVFVALRLLTYLVEDEGSAADVALYRSLIFSCSILSSVGIYFVPKFLHKEGDKGIYDLRTTATIPRTMRDAFFKQASNSGLKASSRHMDCLVEDMAKKNADSSPDTPPADRPTLTSNIVGKNGDGGFSGPAISMIAEEQTAEPGKLAPADIEAASSPVETDESDDHSGGKSKDGFCQYCGRETEVLIRKDL